MARCCPTGVGCNNPYGHQPCLLECAKACPNESLAIRVLYWWWRWNTLPWRRLRERDKAKLMYQDTLAMALRRRDLMYYGVGRIYEDGRDWF
jgi:hypothetical protein